MISPMLISPLWRGFLGASQQGRELRGHYCNIFFTLFIGAEGESHPGGCDRPPDRTAQRADRPRSEEHTSELQSLMRLSYAVFCLKKKKKYYHQHQHSTQHLHYNKSYS